MKYLILFILLCSFADAYAPDFEITIHSMLGEYKDSFTAGAGPPATDGYDAFADIMQPPGSPSGKYIQMITVVDNNPLTADYRTETVWQITLIAKDPAYEGISGLNSLAWNLDSEGYDLTLLDYGTNSSRIEPIETLDLQQKSTYEFEVDQTNGPYRFIDLVAEFCEEEWSCSPWSDCVNGAQTRSCIDKSSCDTDNSKTSQKRFCEISHTTNSGGFILCEPEWSCTSWSECRNGKQKRTCTDENGCDEEKTENRNCTEVNKTQKSENPSKEIMLAETMPQTEDPLPNSDMAKITGASVVEPEPSIFMGLAIILTIVIAGTAIYFLIKI